MLVVVSLPVSGFPEHDIIAVVDPGFPSALSVKWSDYLTQFGITQGLHILVNSRQWICRCTAFDIVICTFCVLR